MWLDYWNVMDRSYVGGAMWAWADLGVNISYNTKNSHNFLCNVIRLPRYDTIQICTCHAILIAIVAILAGKFCYHNFQIDRNT